jgi:hypothetical protein
MEKLGHEGLNKMLDGFEDRTAEAVCTFAFCRGPGEEPIVFQGRTEVRQRQPFQIYINLTLMYRVLLCGPEAQETLVSEHPYEFYREPISDIWQAGMLSSNMMANKHMPRWTKRKR